MRRGDIHHKLQEATAPYIDSGTKLLVNAVVAGKGDDALAALRGIMSAVAEGEGERPVVSEDPGVGEGSPTTVRRRQKRSLDYQEGRRDYLRAQSATAHKAMVADLSTAWQDDPDPVPAPTKAVADAKATRTAAYADYCDRLSNQWEEGDKHLSFLENQTATLHREG